MSNSRRERPIAVMRALNERISRSDRLEHSGDLRAVETGIALRKSLTGVRKINVEELLREAEISSTMAEMWRTESERARDLNNPWKSVRLELTATEEADRAHELSCEAVKQAALVRREQRLLGRPRPKDPEPQKN